MGLSRPAAFESRRCARASARAPSALWTLRPVNMAVFMADAQKPVTRSRFAAGVCVCIVRRGGEERRAGAIHFLARRALPTALVCAPPLHAVAVPAVRRRGWRATLSPRTMLTIRSHTPHLETRAKESNRRASPVVWKPRGAMKVSDAMARAARGAACSVGRLSSPRRLDLRTSASARTRKTVNYFWAGRSQRKL